MALLTAAARPLCLMALKVTNAAGVGIRFSLIDTPAEQRFF